MLENHPTCRSSHLRCSIELPTVAPAASTGVLLLRLIILKLYNCLVDNVMRHALGG